MDNGVVDNDLAMERDIAEAEATHGTIIRETAATPVAATPEANGAKRRRLAPKAKAKSRRATPSQAEGGAEGEAGGEAPPQAEGGAKGGDASTPKTPRRKATASTFGTPSTGEKTRASKHNASVDQVQGWKQLRSACLRNVQECAMEAHGLSALDGACLLVSALGDSGLGTLLRYTLGPVLINGIGFHCHDVRLLFKVERDKLLRQVKEGSRAITQFTTTDVTQGAAFHMGGCIMLALAVAGFDGESIQRAKGMLQRGTSRSGGRRGKATEAGAKRKSYFTQEEDTSSGRR